MSHANDYEALIIRLYEIMRTKILRGFFGICILNSRLALSAQPFESLKFTTKNCYNVGGEGGWDLVIFDTKHRLDFTRFNRHIFI